MNNTFNIKRFGFVFRKDMIENLKRYLLLFLTLLGIMAIAVTFNSWVFYSNNYSADIHLYANYDSLIMQSFMFLAAGVWFASTFSTPMNSKLKRISFLTFPASNLEKFLTRWIVITIGFIIAFFTAMWIADALRVTICSYVYPEIDIKYLDLSKLVYPGKDYSLRGYMVPKSVFILLLCLYFLLQSIFLLGSTFWEKLSFIKTFTACTVICTAIFYICRLTIILFYGNLDVFGNMMRSFEWLDTMTEEKVSLIAASIMAVFTVTFWVVSYFRLKESEIINRL